MKRDKLFILLFIVVIYSFLIFFPIAFFKDIHSNSHELGNTIRPRIHAKTEMMHDYQNDIEKYKAKIENVILYRFPLYNAILEKNSKGMEALNISFYKTFLPLYHNIPLKKSGNLYYFDNYVRQRFVKLYSFDDKTSVEQFTNAANFYNAYEKKLNTAFPEINLYLYYVPSVWREKNDLENSVYPYDEYNFIDQFKTTLSDTIPMTYFYAKNLDTYHEKFYKTDHHWNIFGAYQAYGQLIDLFNQKIDVGPAKEIDTSYQVEGVKFRGSMARTTMSTKYYDELWDMDLKDMPPMNVLVDDKEPSKGFSMRSNYLEGKIPSAPYTNFYGTYWHEDRAKITYKTNLSTGRNLLVFGDSSDNCMEKFIAAHFDSTTFIDFRLYSEKYGTDIDALIKDNHTTDIVFLSGYSTFMWDNINQSFLLR